MNKINEGAHVTEGSYGLQAWLERLSDSDLPALASVVVELQRMAENHNASVQQLADVLLRDASLTSKVLRVANSSYYNPAKENIKTISRAIVLIGFESVRLISLSVSLIDGLLSRAPRYQLPELLARSFHAAVQARNIAGYILSKNQEEVFIAALLHHLGELAFWGCGGDQADELGDALAEAGVDANAAVHKVLGASFNQLTQGLIKSWNLGAVASITHEHGRAKSPAAVAVHLGVRISEVALDGWDSPEMDALVQQFAMLTGISVEDAMQQVLASAEETVKIAATFGASKLCQLIPNTDPEQIQIQREQRKARLLQANLHVMQQALQDLALMITGSADVGLVLDTLLKGLHQGAGLERVMLAVLSDGQSRFRVKHAVGEGVQAWLSDFALPVGPHADPHIFSYVLRNKEAIWMGVPASYNFNDLVSLPMRQSLGLGMFFIAPLLAGKREIGVLYADCRLSGRALKHEQFVAFKRFADLTGRCLDAMSRRKS
ncbi:MAG: HD-like signal output (HDOD) protein [Pseudomonas sp.]